MTADLKGPVGRGHGRHSATSDRRRPDLQCGAETTRWLVDCAGWGSMPRRYPPHWPVPIPGVPPQPRCCLLVGEVAQDRGFAPSSVWTGHHHRYGSWHSSTRLLPDAWSSQVPC